MQVLRPGSAEGFIFHSCVERCIFSKGSILILPFLFFHIFCNYLSFVTTGGLEFKCGEKKEKEIAYEGMSVRC